MSALPAAPPELQASAQQADDVAALELMLGRKVALAERVGTGRNSRAYRVRSGSQEYAAKVYFGPTADGRDRLEVEFTAFEFLWRRGLSCIPQPLQADYERHIGLYQFVAGEPIDAREAVSDDIEQLVAFVDRLHQIARDPAAATLPTAAEAFFAAPEIVRNLHARLAALEAAPLPETADALHRFLQEEFRPALQQFANRAEATVPELDRPHRTLSPSDLGFHNALRAPDGRIIFLDFEYFGWDDPAKTLCDAELHPRMQLPPHHRQRLAAGFEDIFGGHDDWRNRVDALYPLFALKWCLIMLNEFRPDQIARRRYVDGGHVEAAAIQARQLEAARSMLAQIVELQGRFPHWGIRRD